MQTPITIKYVDDGKIEAQRLATYLREEDRLQLSDPEPQASGQNRGALGVGSVILTIVVTTAAREVVKWALDRLEKYLAERDREITPDNRVELHVWIEDAEMKTSQRFTIPRQGPYVGQITRARSVIHHA